MLTAGATWRLFWMYLSIAVQSKELRPCNMPLAINVMYNWFVCEFSWCYFIAKSTLYQKFQIMINCGLVDCCGV